MGQRFQKAFSLVCALIVSFNLLAVPAFASYTDRPHSQVLNDYGALGYFASWIVGTKAFGYTSYSDNNYAANKPQKYYTTPTSSVQDKYGNVTNYYRGGDTTNTSIIDSYNKTFNTIHNTTNNTNNYSANVKLENFLNQYTTNNNNYTYSADFKSWYYDNTTNNYNYNQFTKNDYTQNNLYYNQDNSKYYISIDNSTDEYYLIDVQYSPTFVTVNYTYNTTNNNYNEKVGDVTNIYYYELADGRNSATLPASEVAGIDFGYDVANYVLVADDPNTLSLQHFDGDYSDSSSFGRSFYSQNRSTTYVDSGAFGKAVSLPNGSAAGVTIPNLSNYSSLSFDFRVYYSDISSLGIYLGDTNIFGEVIPSREWHLYTPYDDNAKIAPDDISLGISPVLMQGGVYMYSLDGSGMPVVGERYTLSELSTFLGQSVNYQWSSTLSGTNYLLDSDSVVEVDLPTSFDSPGFVPETGKKYGWMLNTNAPSLYSSVNVRSFECIRVLKHSTLLTWAARFRCRNRLDRLYRWSPSQYVVADFSYDSYRNQWVSMRITISGGRLYYFVNGDLVGSGSFTKPTADKFYIKSSGTVYLDELRVTTGSLSSTSSYNPSNAPYDTNKVLALPDKLTADTIYVQHSTAVTNYRIGGVRPSNPSNGYFYIPLHADYTGGQPQMYVDGNWVNVTAMVYNGSTTVNALGFQFSPMGANSDVINPENCSHNWVEKDRIDATCTASGSARYSCSKCSKTKEETVSALGHDWAETSRANATCTASGSILSTCSRCSETKTATIPALGGNHVWVETSRTPATCVSAGSVVSSCSRCQEVKTETLPLVPDAHDWQETNRVDALCLKSGFVEWTCSRCNRTKRETLPALGHGWLEPVVNPATCLQDGLKTTYCSRCDETIVQTLPATDHSWILIRTVTTQYDQNGNKIQAGYVLYECEYCKEQYRTTDSTQRPPAPGDDIGTCVHDWVENIADYLAPTCTLAGVKSYVCSKCEKVKLESIPLLDHDWKVKATIPNQYDDEGNQISIGFTIFECLRCQEQYKSIDGTAPPSLNPGGSSTTTPGDNGEEKEGFLGWLMRKIGEVLGAIGGGILGLIRAALGKIFDGIIDLITMAFSKLAQLVDLFGSFGDTMGVLWTWLPEEIVLVLVAGVTVFVFVGLLKVFMK